MAPLAFIIILNWNGRQHLQDCLDSLSSVDYSNYRILLVDNNSQDESVVFVKSNYSYIHVIQNEKNLGFAEGNNVGIRYALSQGAKYIVLLNNDTRVEPDFLTRLIQRGEERQEVGVIGGKVLMFSNPRIVNSTGVNLNQFAYGWDRDFGEETQDVRRDAGEVLAVTGCLLVVKREVFERIGLFDSKFFAYFEDMDFCIRVWKHTDFTVEYVPEAVIYHKFSSSYPGESFLKRKLMLRNRYRIFFKHFPLYQIFRTFPLLSLHRVAALRDYRLGRDFYFLALEFFILLKYWALLPFFLLRRLPELIRGISSNPFWDKVIPEKKTPLMKIYVPGYEKIFLKKEDLGGNRISHRMIIGVNDEVLGQGWSMLEEGFPRIRRVGEEALCFLRSGKKFGYLQIHGLCDSIWGKRWVEVAIEGRLLGRIELKGGWNTYILPFENHFEEGPVEVQLRTEPFNSESKIEKGFGINEIGLFSLGSPQLRWMEG